MNRRNTKGLGRYYTTTDLNKALMYGYIGESTIIQNPLSMSIYYALYGVIRKPFTFYYCGEPDDLLKKRFGYEEKSE